MSVVGGVVVRRLSLDERVQQPTCRSLVSPQTMAWRQATGRSEMHCNKKATMQVGPEFLCRTHASLVTLTAAITRGTL